MASGLAVRCKNHHEYIVLPGSISQGDIPMCPKCYKLLSPHVVREITSSDIIYKGVFSGSH